MKLIKVSVRASSDLSGVRDVETKNVGFLNGEMVYGKTEWIRK